MAEDSAFWGGTTVGDVATTVLWNSPYNSSEFSDIYNKLLMSGIAKGYVLPGYNNGLRVTANSPTALNVLVDTGAMMVGGRIYENTASLTATIAAADATNPRIDRIVVRASLLDSVQTIRVAVLTGTPGATPALPALTQNATTFEISLAYVWVAALATTIANTEIHDEREFAINYNATAYDTTINQIRNSEFLATIVARTYPPAEWSLVSTPSAIATATKPAQMLRGNYVQITAGGASQGISQTIPVVPSTPYAIKQLVNVTAGDVGTIVVSTNSASPGTITRIIRRTGVDLEERIFYTTESDATTLTIQLIAVNNTDVVKFGQTLILPGYNAGPYRVCNYEDDVILWDRLILTSAQATFDFQSLPTGYRAIRFVCSLRGTVAAGSENITLKVNNDGGANYDSVLATIAHSATLATTEVVAGTAATIATIPGNTAPANVFAGIEILIVGYDQTSFQKTGALKGSLKIATTTGNFKSMQSTFFWRSTAAINRLTLTSPSTFATGSIVDVYLVK